MSSPGPRLPYMPGLDGVRALAVAAVIGYHAGLGGFSGGFLGVDVFFVLSGYLITSLLLAERAATGVVALGRFWLGRARRLLPAALLVILASLLVVALFLPGDLGSARGDALASALYVNNWHQILADRSYFEAFGRPSLFQHLWSLSVEEQFYVVWPLLLTLGIARLGRTRTAALTAVVAIGSAVLMAVLFDPHADASRVYYGSDTRAAPLLIGALLAFAWPPARMSRRTGPWAGTVLDAAGAAGLAGLVAATVLLTDFDPFLYRGGLVLAALAAALLIGAVAHPAARIGRWLGARPLRWVGRRSYGIYLWHWPVMALTRPGTDLPWPRGLVIALQVALAVGLAALSYRYLEMPIRNGEARRRLAGLLGRRRPRQRLALVAAATVVLLVPVGWAFGRPAGTGRAAALAHLLPSSSPASAAQPPATSMRPHRHHRSVAPAPHRKDPPLAVGESVMLAAKPALERRLGAHARVDAAVGRQPTEVIARLEDYKRHGTLPDRVIVQLGDNGPVWSADVARLRKALAGVREVVLVNVRVPRSWEGEVNDQLEQAVRDWPEARIADWHDASADPDLLYDEAHPNPAGQKVYARVVVKALRAG